MGRRAMGEGTTYFDENKELWIYQVSYHNENGIRQRKKFKSKTKREAMKKGKEFLDGIAKGLKPNGGKITVGEWVSEWLANYVRPRIRPRTFEKYQSSINNYILPVFAETPLDELKAADVQKHLGRVGKLIM